MKLTIDHTLCAGHGRCYSLAPDVYDSDDEGYGQVRSIDVPPQFEVQARYSKENCPERAISITE